MYYYYFSPIKKKTNVYYLSKYFRKRGNIFCAENFENTDAFQTQIFSVREGNF